MIKEAFTLDVGKENRVIRGDIYAKNEEATLPTLILCHGFKGFKDWGFFPIIAHRLAEAGFAVITFNFSMNGVGEDLENFTELDRFGRLTFTREQEDLDLVVYHIHQGTLPLAHVLNPNELGLFGHSRGGGNALIYAFHHPTIRAVVVWNSISKPLFFDESLIQEIQQNGIAYLDNARTQQKMPIRLEVLEDIWANENRYNILHHLTQFQTPLLLLQGDQDASYLVQGAAQMASANPGAKLHIIKGGNHTFGSTHPFKNITPQLEEATLFTMDFFARNLT